MPARRAAIGTFFVSRIDAESEKFPPVCMVCGERETTNLRPQQYTWYPPWTALFLFCGLLPALIAMLITQKKARVNIRVCDTCTPTYSSLPLYGAIVGVTAFAVFIFGIVMMGSKQESVGCLLLLGALVMPLVYVFTYNNRYAITCRGIDDLGITLLVPGDRYPQIYQDYSHRAVKPMASSPACPECGKRNMGGSRFCEACGAELR